MATAGMEQTYRDVEGWLYTIVSKFHQKYGGDFDEMVGRAYLMFMKAYHVFDPKRGAFTTVLYHAIWSDLLTYNDIRHKPKNRMLSLDVEDENGQTYASQAEDTRTIEQFDLREFCRGMTEDATTVLQLIFDTPAELSEQIGLSGRSWRTALRSYLRDLGWQAARVSEAFNEVKGALA